MSARLKFKGESSTSGKKKRRRDDGPSKAKQEEPEQLEGWVSLPSPEHAHGPLFITQAGNDERPPTAIALSNKNAKVVPYTFQDAEEDARSEPKDVNHVFVCTKLMDSAINFTLRATNNHFLAIDAVGSLVAEREARGQQEELVFVAHPSLKDRYCIKSVMFGTYLSVDEVAGGKLDFRGDVKEADIGPDEAFEVKMQARNLGEWEKRQQTDRKTEADDGLVVIGNVKEAEERMIRQSQTRGMGRLITSQEDTRELKKARKNGTFAEALLDRRSKLKQSVCVVAILHG